MNQRKSLIGYLICATMFLCGIFSLLSNRSYQFEEFNTAAKNGQALALNSEFHSDSLFNVLYNCGYITDPKDARMAADWIYKKIQSGHKIPNLGSLLKDSFKIPADTALILGGKETKLRVDNDYHSLGQDAEYNSIKNSTLSNTYGDDLEDNACINVTVISKDPLRQLSNIPVRLREHYIEQKVIKSTLQDTVYQEEIADSTIAWAKTDSEGRVRFFVPKGKYYSVVPINRGYQYGKARGTTSSELTDKGLNLRFSEKIHTLTPISRSVFSNIKADNALTARTPADYKRSLFIGCLIYLIGWAVVLFLALFTDYRLKTTSDYLSIIILMTLSGIGTFAWHSITDPLCDIAHGSSMSVYLGIGLLGFAVLYSINWAKFYHGKSRIQPQQRFTWLLNISQNKGWAFLGMAIFLFVMLALFGTGPEGSVAKVNLGPIQPSEICKFLILIFIAAFFADKYTLIQKFSEKATALTSKRKLRIMSVITLAMIALMGIYFYLSDGGPALVLLFTFIILYSVVRQDLGKMLLGVSTFAVCLLAAWFISESMIIVVIAAVAWYAGWMIYCLKQRTIFESALFMNLIPLLFILMNAFLGGNEGARMSNRTGMAWGNVWENTVQGGDQIAQGLWGVASGGLTGMGLGNGSPSSIPACHTDMAFLSIGEMLGFVGLLLVVLCMFALIHRTLLIGRKAGNPFVMFFVMGLGIMTGVQFLVIVFGSLGLFPLTGINVPFLSQGGVSLVMMLTVYGIALSASRLKTTEAQKENARKLQGAVAAGALIFMVGGIVIIATLAKYQIFDKSDTLIRPALMTNTEGARIVEYNPRIDKVLRRLESGNIYDRNGLLLATSNRNSVKTSQDTLIKAGANKAEITAMLAKTQQRYYPFGNHTLFMIGDANTRKVYSYYDANPTGYLAEYRHLSELRGLDIPITKVVTLTADEYKPNRFMSAQPQSFTYRLKDYSALLPFLELDIHNNHFIEEHNKNRPERDLSLTIDAKLQVALQQELKKYISNPANGLKNYKDLRASVVILDSRTGDLLSSANYPLPEQDSIVMLNERRIWGDAPAEKLKGHAPITERDLGLTFQSQPGSTAKVMSAIAALMKEGPDAANQWYDIGAAETVEPPGVEPIGKVTMERAIVKSSNCYFIKLVHEKELYSELDTLYQAVGARVQHFNAPYESQTPYYFHIGELSSKEKFSDLMTDIGINAINTYQFNKKRGPHKMWWAQTAVAWGQGALRATPLNMARVASIVANDGKLVPTRYTLSEDYTSQSISVIDEKSAKRLKSFMQGESDKHRSNGYSFPKHSSADKRMGGKTGTPERTDRKGVDRNDAWYICFIESAKTGSPLAIALRIERTSVGNSGFTSGLAVKVMANSVIFALDSVGYKVGYNGKKK